MKQLAISLLAAIAALPAFAQMKVDTIYYDKNWKCITTQAFATYFRVIEKTTDTTNAKPYRGYFITGELQAEGEYISFDTSDDTKSVFDGEFEAYYKNGKTAEKGSWKRGVRDGEYTSYNEDGLIRKHLYYVDGELNGICTEFSEDGSTCVQTEYANGQPRYDYYVISNKDGLCSMVSLATGKPIYEAPSPSDMTVEYIEELPWATYNKNGIILQTNYHGGGKVSVIMTNNSMFPIDISYENVSGTSTTKNGNVLPLKVRSFTDFSKSLERNQLWDSFFNALGENLAASNAGKSVSQTTSAYAGTHGSGATASVTTSYDATAAYQARITASNRVAAYNESLEVERKISEQGYLKKTTVQPGETIVGYVMCGNKTMDMKTVFDLCINIEINGIIYTSKWSQFRRKTSLLTE